MRYKKHLIVILFAALLMQGCDLEQDVAPMPTFDGEANTTIAELLAMHTIGSEDSYDSIPVGSNIVICGYVTTSDEWGNNYTPAGPFFADAFGLVNMHDGMLKQRA